MKRRRYVIGILLCVTALLQAQDSVKSFDEFFVAGMDKIDGVFPVYVAEKEIYLEIPEKYIGREIEVSGQIDRGFDLLNRPVDGLGVVRIISPDKATICFQKPFYTERILDKKSTYQQSFSLSNMQPAGKSYPVVAYSKEQGAIIRITEYLMTGDDWFSYNDNFILLRKVCRLRSGAIMELKQKDICCPVLPFYCLKVVCLWKSLVQYACYL